MTKGLISAIQTGSGLTKNNMPTNISTGSHLVDLFGKIASMRKGSEEDILALFTAAFAEDAVKALKILFWTRDVRGGAGERRAFRIIVKYLATKHTSAVKQNLTLFPVYGRWDDLLEMVDTPLEKDMLWLIDKGLRTDEDNLCRKWMPRKGRIAFKLRTFMKLKPKEYRQLLVKGPTVEQKMSAKDWEGIKYETVPSLAMSRYSKAFSKHDSDSWKEFKDVPENLAKVKSGTLYPYDVLKNLVAGDAKIAEAQWKNLPNYVTEGERILPMVDTSGSMGTEVASRVTALDVAVSIGLYLSERNEGPYKDSFITFSAKPALQTVKGTLSERVRQMRNANWDMNTDLEAAYDLILNQAVRHGVAQEDMPTKLIILSDMEFDAARGFDGGRYKSYISYAPTAQEMVTKKFADAGYTLPALVYWNINARIGNDPVRFDEKGTQWVSGYSPAILKGCLTGEAPEIDMRTPEDVMNEVIGDERYSAVRLVIEN